MRTLPLLLGLSVLAGAPAALAPRAAADAFTNHLEPIVTEMVQRDGSIAFPPRTKEERRQRSALSRGFRALAADSRDLAGDFRMAKRLVRILEKGFPGDAEFPALCSTAAADLGGAAVTIRDELETTIATLAEGRHRTRATARLARADALRAAGDAEPSTVRRLALHGKAHRQVLKGARIAAKGQPPGPSNPSTMTATVGGAAWAANDDYGQGVTGLVERSEVNLGVRKVVVTGRRTLPGTGPPDPPNPPLPGDFSRIEITIQRVSQDIVEGGTYIIGTADGVNCTASWYEELEDGTVINAVATSGTVTLPTLDPEFGTATIGGTFDLTMYEGGSATSFGITGGAFQAVDVPLQTLP